MIYFYCIADAEKTNEFQKYLFLQLMLIKFKKTVNLKHSVEVVIV